MTAADKYYIKARDNYPYNLEEVLEALDYGLGCDEEHAGLLTLKGNIYFRYLKQFDAAAECFELALFYNVDFVDAYYSYIEFALAMKNCKKATRLIEKAKQVRGIDYARLFYHESILFEKQHQYKQAISQIKLARQHCNNKAYFEFCEEELERLQSKNKIAEMQKANIHIEIK